MTNDTVFKAGAVILGLFLLYKIFSACPQVDPMSDYMMSDYVSGPVASPMPYIISDDGEEEGEPVMMTRTAPPTVSDSLLPGVDQEDDDFSEFAPNVLKSQNFLDPASFIGLNTVSGSLRIPNYSVRYQPPNPTDPVSVFNNSTVEPDMYRNRSFDIMA